MKTASSPAGLAEWAATQGHILTGGGQLESRYKDFKPEDLPHYHLSRQTCWEVFPTWQPCDELIGAWDRPLFMGGWKESTYTDTEVFNLQTRALFVDLRFPKAREPVFKSIQQRGCKNFHELDLAELKLLARQHAFAGFSKMDRSSSVCVRHHCIDWNFHPEYPRPRPNAWRYLLSPDRESFKEYSVASDEHGQAVYMERWQRFDASKSTLALYHESAVLCIVGHQFALARNRPSIPQCPGAAGGGCAALVDSCLSNGRREAAEALLNLEGSYGVVDNGFHIKRSTIPWREGQILAAGGITLGADGRPVEVTLDGQRWRVFDCTFDVAELQKMFSAALSRL